LSTISLMPLHTIAIPPSAAFWEAAAARVLRAAGGEDGEGADRGAAARDFSHLRVVVPTFVHAQLLKQALAAQVGGSFLPPAIATLAAWLDLLPPAGKAPSPGERLMALYADLRDYGWLKKLFGAKHNPDLLPLADILLALSDELTQALLPAMEAAPDVADRRWQGALEQLAPAARTLLSDETQLVWSIWKSQLDGDDALVAGHRRMMQLAAQLRQPLCWISPVAPDAMERAFLDACAARQPVTVLTLDWHAASLPGACAAAWPEILDGETDAPALAPLPHLKLHAARSLEDEACAGAQTVINWLQAGRLRIAIVAQDRVVARRMRALLERAQVTVADETGWKLSTTRAAAALAAWFELTAVQADTIALLDFLKSPFVFADMADRAEQVMAIELILRRADVTGGWEAIDTALAAKNASRAQAMVAQLAAQAREYDRRRRRTLCEWLAATGRSFAALGMREALLADAAGGQILQLLQDLERDCRGLSQPFSCAEFRAFLDLQLEAAAFTQAAVDRRVVMLPLNGARLRGFDAVLVAGVDADHLPSRPAETLFFANRVRAELGLATRESRQRQQLRDFAELLCANAEVVLSWQASRDGEPVAVSPWIERLQLALARAGLPMLSIHQVRMPLHQLRARPASMPAPAAPTLRPVRLSASGYNQLVACPYQFFAARMLGLSGIEELSELPEKRDYGQWLHTILLRFHQTLHDRAVPPQERPALLMAISREVFAQSLDHSGAALGYFARWEKAMPAYLDWVAEREAQGWQFAFGEVHLERTLRWDGGEVVLHGYADRIDQSSDGARAVLDYKSAGQKVLADRLKRGEDQQLPFYGLLSEELATALYVPLEPDKERIRAVEAPDFDTWRQMLAMRIAGSMQAIDRGAPLPATGPESVCRYCEARGLCRKGAW